MNIDPKDIKKILIVNLGGVGDMLLSTPALRAISKRYNGAKMYIITIPRSAELAKKLPYIDAVFEFYTESGVIGTARNMATLLALRREGIDLAVNMRTMVSRKGASGIKALFDVIRPRIRAGRDTGGMGDFFDIKVPEPPVGTRYEMDYDIETARYLGPKPPTGR